MDTYVPMTSATNFVINRWIGVSAGDAADLRGLVSQTLVLACPCGISGSAPF